MQIFFILGIPVLLALTALLVKKQRIFGILNSIGYLVVLCGSILLLKKTVLSGGVKLCGDFIYLDALSAFFIFVISVVAFAAALYSVGYIRKDIEKGIISEKKPGFIIFYLTCSAAPCFLSPR